MIKKPSIYDQTTPTVIIIAKAIYENGDMALTKLEWHLTTEEGKTTEGTGLGEAKRTPDGKWVDIIESPYGV